MIQIIDYGLGNIQAFLNAYKSLDIKAESVKIPDNLKNATHLILPGVGSFDQAMSMLDSSGMKDEISNLVLNNSIPILGVCVGMQILGNQSDEGSSKGLGFIDGSVRKIKLNNQKYRYPLPHMGWNDIFIKKNKIFNELELNPKFYFLHSYHFECDDNSSEIASFSYESEMTCAINKNNIYGVQFHPEKSHHFGVKLLKNFSEIKYAKT